jgi:hypothetical protein
MGVEVVEALEWEHRSDRAKDSDAGDQVFEALERRRSLRAQTSSDLGATLENRIEGIQNNAQEIVR